MTSVVMPLPDRGFDPTETSVPWRALRDAGVDVVFATERGQVAACDVLLLRGVVFGQLGAKREHVDLYHRMVEDPSFRAPAPWSSIDVASFDGIVLPGGHAKPMRQYLESRTLQDAVVAFVRAGRPIASICHGGVLLARSIDPTTGKSVVAGRTITALPKWMELSAWLLSAWKLGDYYRTYPVTVEDELVQSGVLFQCGPLSSSYAQPFVVEDGNILSARWPGDAHELARRYVAALGGSSILQKPTTVTSSTPAVTGPTS